MSEDNKLQKKIICITGGKGFIGRQLINKLNKSNCQIRALTRNKNNNFPRNINIFIGDLTDPNFSLTKFLKNCDILYNCAGEINDEKKMDALHINGTQKLINAVKQEAKISKKKLHWIQLSSCGAYGPPNYSEIETERLITETSKTRPTNKYERTKTKADEMVMKSSYNNFYYTILRPSNVIGITMTNQSIRKLIKLINSKYFFFIGKKDSISTFIHVDDVVRALILISINLKSRDEIFNLSSDCTWEALIKQISSNLNIEISSFRLPFIFIKIPFYLIKVTLGKLIKIPKLESFAYRTSYSTKKIENFLNFKFTKPIPDSIGDLID